MLSAETRLRNSLLSFVKINCSINALEAFENHSFMIDDTHIAGIRSELGLVSRTAIDVLDFPISGAVIMIGFEKDGKFDSRPIEFDNAEILTTYNHENIAKISYFGFHGTENPASKTPGVRGLATWLRYRLGTSKNFRKFIQNLEMLNIELV